MKKLMIWTAIHCAHWAVLYGAFALGMEGAVYVLKFFAWAMAFASPLLLTEKAKETGVKGGPAPVRATLTRVQSWATLLLLVWFGHIVTALAWCMVMFCVALHREGVKKMRVEQAQAVV